MVVFRELERYSREMQDARGYQEISTPILVNKRLWEQSGHWEHYAENMFRLEVDEQVFSLKPMNCPESTYVYRQALRSYRDLPAAARRDGAASPERALRDADRAVPRAAVHAG